MDIEQPQITPVYSVASNGDQAVTSNTTPQNSSLRAVLDGNSTYIIEIYAPFSLAGILSGYKFGFAVPANLASFICSPRVITNAAASLTTSILTSAASTISGVLATASNHTFVCNLTMTTTNPGEFIFQFAQNTSDLGAITLKRGAYISAKRV